MREEAEASVGRPETLSGVVRLTAPLTLAQSRLIGFIADFQRQLRVDESIYQWVFRQGRPILIPGTCRPAPASSASSAVTVGTPRPKAIMLWWPRQAPVTW